MTNDSTQTRRYKPMIMCMAMLGDTSVTVYSSQALDRNEEIQTWYSLCFRDLPTGETGELVTSGENDAVMLFSAWLIADEQTIGSMEPYVKRLYEHFGQKSKFLP